MGAWTKQPGDVSLYALIRRDQFTEQRIDAIGSAAAASKGRAIERSAVLAWLRRYAALLVVDNGTESVQFEMPADEVSNLPDGLARQFVPLEQLERVGGGEDAPEPSTTLDELFGTEQGEL